jgi:hypothetical protein
LCVKTRHFPRNVEHIGVVNTMNDLTGTGKFVLATSILENIEQIQVGHIVNKRRKLHSYCFIPFLEKTYHFVTD